MTGPSASAQLAARSIRHRAIDSGTRLVVLVEGVSDRVALETLAARSGLAPDANGVMIVSIGGATTIGYYLSELGPAGLGIELAGMCDIGEEAYFRRSLDRAGLDGAHDGFVMCDIDLEDELIRALGPAAVEGVIEHAGQLASFRAFQKQPAQRDRGHVAQLRRFLGTHSGRKEQYARLLVEALDLEHVPRPLDALLNRL